RILSPVPRRPKGKAGKEVAETGPETLAYSLARESQNCPAEGTPHGTPDPPAPHHTGAGFPPTTPPAGPAQKPFLGRSTLPEPDPSTSPPADPLDPDLARVLTAWPTLPEAIRRAILALVGTAGAR